MKRILLYAGLLFLFSCEYQDNGVTSINEVIQSEYLLDGNLDSYVQNTQIVRLTGKPGVITVFIGSSDLSKYEPCFVLYVATGTTPSTTVSSAIIKLDEMVVLNTSDFSKNGGQYQFEVCNLTQTSELTVEVRGEPDSYINVWIEGKLRLIDCDGNIYKTVQIGNQVWMAENLKTTKYQDCTPIKNGLVAWSTEPAFAWYDNDLNNKAYGALYNWYAVNTGNLCPDGWHVPSDIEWAEMEKYIGVPDDQLYLVDFWRGTDQGTMLKSKIEWPEEFKGTDVYGFNAIPAGQANGYCEFWELGMHTHFQTSTELNSIDSWRRSLHNDKIGIQRYYTWKHCGYSVRCIKD